MKITPENAIHCPKLVVVIQMKLKAFLKEHLADYKVPKEFIVVGDLPKNNAGKLLKREIKKQFS